MKHMTKKEKFLQEIEGLIENGKLELSEDSLNYFKELTQEKSKLTEQGEKILVWMQENKDKYHNVFKASDIGAGLDISAKSVSGSMRNLVNNNYVKKLGKNPTTYSLIEEENS